MHTNSGPSLFALPGAETKEWREVNRLQFTPASALKTTVQSLSKLRYFWGGFEVEKLSAEYTMDMRYW